MATLSLHNLTKSYRRGVQAVRELSLDVADGEFTVLVGPSGCGKTTALRMIAGLEKPDAGEIRIGDTRVNDTPPRDRDVAMVFQNAALYPHMTARQNMGFALKMRKASREEIAGRVNDVAELLGVESLLDRKPGELSGGELQRVALGRALVRRPALILLDEPLSQLDASLRAGMRSEISALLRAAGTTVIYVTHDQEEAMALGDRLVVMCDGAVQQVGTPMEVYQRPANQFVASFIGRPPMNLIDGRVERDGGNTFFQSTGGEVRLQLPDPIAFQLMQISNHEFTLGARASAIQLIESAADSGSSGIGVEVQSVEQHGEYVDVACVADTIRLMARIPGVAAACRPGSVRAIIDTSQVYLFEQGSAGRLIANSD